MKVFVGPDEIVDFVGCHGRLGKARENQLELAGIGDDVPYGVDAGCRGRQSRWVDADEVFSRLRPQRAIGPSSILRP